MPATSPGPHSNAHSVGVHQGVALCTEVRGSGATRSVQCIDHGHDREHAHDADRGEGEKNLVAAGLADRAEVQIAYAIGVARPVSVMVETFGTETIPRALIDKLVAENFDLRPAAFREDLDPARPRYATTAAYGHFSRDGAEFTWERTDRAGGLADAAGTTPLPA
jgi:hypothetical protein